MADTTVGYTPGTGADVAVDDTGAGGLIQIVKLSEIPTGAATEAKQDTIIGHVDGVETAIASTNTKLDTVNTNLGAIDGRVDGLETLVTSTNTKLDTVNTNLGTIDGRVDGLETLTGAVNETAPATDTANSGLNGRLQRIAQRITSLIALVPTALSSAGAFKVGFVDIAGTAIDANSGNKSAGTQRVVLATDQPQLTNKLLVTPDANSAVNVSQMNGVAVTMGTGNSGTGVQRVVLATDQPQLTNKLLVTPDANSAVNVAQFGGTNVVNGGVAGVQSVGGNVAIAATATANPVPVGGVFQTSPTTLTNGQTAALQFTNAQNLKNDFTTVAGTTVATNTGNSSAGVQRVVLATDQPQLTNKLLVTPDANSAVNVAQMNGVTVTMNTGAVGTGVQRVTLATDVKLASVAAQTTQQFSTTKIDTASSGDLALISNTAAQTGRLFRLMVVAAGATTLKFKDGSTDLTGAMTINPGGSLVLDYTGEPWFVTTANTALNLNNGSAVQISGIAYWTKS